VSSAFDLVFIHHHVRNVVVIDPLHRRSHGNRQFWGRKVKLWIVITFAVSCAATEAAANIAPTIGPISTATMTARLIANRAAARRTDLCPRSSSLFWSSQIFPAEPTGLDRAPNCAAKLNRRLDCLGLYSQRYTGFRSVDFLGQIADFENGPGAKEAAFSARFAKVRCSRFSAETCSERRFESRY
jgi:hypothetical protein